MRYKIEILKIGIGNDKTIDIPEGCIPIKYDCSIERRYPLPSFIRTLTILRPIGNIEDKELEDKKIEDNQYVEEEIYKKCFFCEENLTRDKVGIRSICPICLGELYGLAIESHKSQEC